MEVGYANSTYSYVANGSFVTDAFSPQGVSSQTDIYESKERYEFFLVHNLTLGPGDPEQHRSYNGDGILGLEPDLGSKKETYGQYLKKTK